MSYRSQTLFRRCARLRVVCSPPCTLVRSQWRPNLASRSPIQLLHKSCLYDSTQRSQRGIALVSQLGAVDEEDYAFEEVEDDEDYSHFQDEEQFHIEDFQVTRILHDKRPLSSPRGGWYDRRVLALRRWGDLFRTLSFPEDGDLMKARIKLQEQRAFSVSFVGEGDLSTIQHKWAQAEHYKTEFGPELLIGCLAESTKLALLALSCIEYPVGGWRTRAECLQYIKRTGEDELNANPDLMQAFQDQLAFLRDPQKWPKTHMQQVHLDMMLQDLPEDAMRSLLNKYLETYPYTDSETLLLIVDYYTRMEDVDSALTVLYRLPKERVQQDDLALIGRCINLLILDKVKQANGERRFKILTAILELGIRPISLIHNITIQNAIKENLPNVAWDLFYYMRKENLHTNSYTHLALLKDSFLRHDVRALNEIMSAIHEREDLASDPYLVAYTMNIVRNICYHDRKTDASEALSHLLAVYDRAYDRAPLLKLGMVRTKSIFSAGSTRPEPIPSGLAYTIWSYVLVQRQEHRVTELWDRLIQLIKEKDPQILEAAKFDVFYSGFILFYARYPKYLTKAINVLKYMLDLGFCDPKDSTWGVVICKFLQYGQEQSAERIRKTMAMRGVKVTPEAWEYVLRKFPNSEIAGKIQDILDARDIPEGLDKDMGDPILSGTPAETQSE